MISFERRSLSRCVFRLETHRCRQGSSRHERPKSNKSESFSSIFTEWALNYTIRTFARFLASMLLENYEDATSFVGARPKSKLKPVSRTAENALHQRYSLFTFSAFPIFSLTSYVNSDHILQIWVTSWVASRHTHLVMTRFLCERALSIFSLRRVLPVENNQKQHVINSLVK